MTSWRRTSARSRRSRRRRTARRGLPACRPPGQGPRPRLGRVLRSGLGPEAPTRRRPERAESRAAQLHRPGRGDHDDVGRPLPRVLHDQLVVDEQGQVIVAADSPSLLPMLEMTTRNCGVWLDRSDRRRNEGRPHRLDQVPNKSAVNVISPSAGAGYPDPQVGGPHSAELDGAGRGRPYALQTSAPGRHVAGGHPLYGHSP